MIPNTPTITIPLRADAGGNIRVSGTRVTLVSLLDYYRQGESADDLHAAFPAVPLRDIHAVIAYYLANREALDAYLDDRHTEAERIREASEATYTPEQRAFQERFRERAQEKRRG